MIQRNVLEYLDKDALTHPDHIFIREENNSYTYKEARDKAYALGNIISKKVGVTHRPIMVYIEKSMACLVGMFGAIFSGNFYVCTDTKMPVERLNSIVTNLKPVAVVTCDASSFPEGFDTSSFEVIEFKLDELDDFDSEWPEKEAKIRESVLITDPAYVLYTSGSTGVPKGSVISHGAVIQYAEWLADTFNFSDKTVFGSQTPFYFSMSVLDIYSTIRNAATLVIIPGKYFSFPVKLLEFVRDMEVNTIYWVPSAFGIVTKWKALDYVELPLLKTILFAGEVMPTKVLNKWREKMPDSLYANLFGPTEITDIALYYIVNRDFSNEEPLPIGICASVMDAFALNDNGKLIEKDEVGELYFRGPFLGDGYYNAPDKTEQAFVQNPLNTAYPEKVYKTGDLVRINEYGEYMYVGRADTQIKHSGYRIELGEIENAACAIEEVDFAAALYNAGKDAIILIYQGKIDEETIIKRLREEYLPSYMVPEEAHKIASMPHNANGKIDRVLLRDQYIK